MCSVSRRCVMRVYNVTPMVRMGVFLLSTVLTIQTKDYLANILGMCLSLDTSLPTLPLYTFLFFLLFSPLLSSLLLFYILFPSSPSSPPSDLHISQGASGSLEGEMMVCWGCKTRQWNGYTCSCDIDDIGTVQCVSPSTTSPTHTHICQLLSFLSPLLPLHFPGTYTFINPTHPLLPLSYSQCMHVLTACLLTSPPLSWHNQSTPPPPPPHTLSNWN